MFSYTYIKIMILSVSNYGSVFKNILSVYVSFFLDQLNKDLFFDMTNRDISKDKIHNKKFLYIITGLFLIDSL